MAGRAVDPHVENAVHRSGLLDALDRLQRHRRDEELHAGAAEALGRLERDLVGPLAERGREREPVQVDPERRLAELRVVAAAEPRRQLADDRGRRSSCGTSTCVYVGPSAIPSACGRGGRLHRRADLGRLERARPGVGERDAEGGRLGGEPVGDGQRVEAAVDRERVDGDLAAVDELLDQEAAAARGCERLLDGVRKGGGVLDEGEAALALPVGRLDDAGEAELARGGQRIVLRAADAVARAAARPASAKRSRWRSFEVESVADAGVERVRQAEPLGDPRRDPDRPVDPRRDDPVDALGFGQPVDPRLVLGRDDRAPVGEAEPGAAGSRSTAIT